MVDSEVRFSLPSDLALVSPLVAFLQNNLKRIGLHHDDGDMHLPIALHEALVNAMTHGNMEVPGHLRESDPDAYLASIKERQAAPPYCDRRVHILARETREEFTFVIRDEGPGFDVSTLPDPADTDDLQSSSGRGLFLIRTFMDEVRFNDVGNEITLIKQRNL
jgi:anti-sigma regulatory factor (Ser/Thr protein kinase)